ncbi:MAG: acyltransferase family protein [Acidimicrobiales bacterium]
MPIAPRPIATGAALRVAAATSPDRQRYVDFLRVASLAVVVLGHWLMAVIEWRDGHLVTGNVLETAPAAQWLTWALQVMPVFFFVGGFANTASWTAAVRDGRGYGQWLGGRLTRLLRPVLVFALVWTAAVVGLRLAGVDPATVRAGSIAQPLWFLAVYAMVVTVAPAMVAAHRRWGADVPLALAGAVAVVDVARWRVGLPLVGWANLALVWLFAHQLGVVWRAGSMAPWSRHRLAALAALGLATLVALTAAFGYPHSMVGGVGETRSNTFPPSLALVALATWQFGLALLARPAVESWLRRPRPWSAVVAANGMAMTVFLWHLTALVLVAAATLPGGLLPGPAAGSGWWWLLRPLWLGLLALVLVPLVAVFARVESARVAPSTPRPGAALAAAVLATAGMAFLARRGFVAPGMPWRLPVAGVGSLAVAWWLLRRPPLPAG